MYKLGVVHVINKEEGTNTPRQHMPQWKESPLYDVIVREDVSEFDRLIGEGEDVDATSPVQAFIMLLSYLFRVFFIGWCCSLSSSLSDPLLSFNPIIIRVEYRC